MLLKLPAIETDELISVVLYHCDIIINSIGTPPEKLVVPEVGCDCSNVSLPLPRVPPAVIVTVPVVPNRQLHRLLYW